MICRACDIEMLPVVGYRLPRPDEGRQPVHLWWRCPRCDRLTQPVELPEELAEAARKLPIGSA